MSKFDRSAFASAVAGFAAKGSVFLDAAFASASDFTAKPFKANGSLTKAAQSHLEGFRTILMDGATESERKADDWQPKADSARDQWNASGMASDSAYRGFATHTVNAVVGIWLDPEGAEHKKLQRLADEGKAFLQPAKPPGKDKSNGEDTMAELLKTAMDLMKRAPRKEPTKWDKEATQFLGEFIAALSKEDA